MKEYTIRTKLIILSAVNCSTTLLANLLSWRSIFSFVANMHTIPKFTAFFALMLVFASHSIWTFPFVIAPADFINLVFVCLKPTSASTIAITSITMTVISANSVFEIHRPCLLQNDHPTMVRKMTYVHSEFSVICVNIVPHKGTCSSVNYVVVLNKF